MWDKLKSTIVTSFLSLIAQSMANLTGLGIAIVLGIAMWWLNIFHAVFAAARALLPDTYEGHLTQFYTYLEAANLWFPLGELLAVTTGLLLFRLTWLLVRIICKFVPTLGG